MKKNLLIVALFITSIASFFYGYHQQTKATEYQKKAEEMMNYAEEQRKIAEQERAINAARTNELMLMRTEAAYNAANEKK